MIRTPFRVGAAVLLAAVAVTGLSSCSGMRSAAAAGPSASAGVVDPSVQQAGSPSAVPTESAAVPSTGDSPTPTPTPTVTTASLKTVAPFITSATASAGAITATALVPAIVEQGGICTLSATKDGVTRQVSSAAVATTSYTGCNPLEVPAAQLGDGTWTVQVSYRSATSSGTSKSRTVEVG